MEMFKRNLVAVYREIVNITSTTIFFFCNFEDNIITYICVVKHTI